MPSFRKPRGLYTRSTPDFFVDDIMAGQGGQGLDPNMQSGIELYNNSTTGSVLHVLAISGWANNAASLFQVSQSTGTLGTTAGNFSGPINANNPLKSGLVYSYKVNAAPGNIIFLLGGNNIPFIFAPGYAIAVIPPNGGLFLTSNANNTFVAVAFEWLVLSQS